jgi:hypothetical protein
VIKNIGTKYRRKNNWRGCSKILQKLAAKFKKREKEKK